MSISYLLEAPVSLSLFILTLAISILGLINENFRDKNLLVPYDTLVYKEYWRILTSGFIHGNGMHLLMNMITFFFFSFMLEHRIGHGQFALLYFASLVISNLMVLIRYRKDTAYEGSLGASGAISGVVLASVICAPYLKFGFPVISEMYPILTLPAYVVAGAYVIFSLVFTLVPNKMKVNHDAHFWGSLAGIILVFILKPGLLVYLERYFNL
ncbi:MAG: rhomboid family intramembrane serine protease [Bacteroidia bacterium]|nr:rhomboid family intramembrane serine protease [Bacteroidia bacterium]